MFGTFKMGFFKAALIVLSSLSFVTAQNSSVSLTASTTISSGTAAASSSAPTPCELLPVSLIAVMLETKYPTKISLQSKILLVISHIFHFKVVAPSTLNINHQFSTSSKISNIQALQTQNKD
jgi:hypothetical protein